MKTAIQHFQDELASERSSLKLWHSEIATNQDRVRRSEEKIGHLEAALAALNPPVKLKGDQAS